MHTYIHTYVRTYIYIHTYVQTYLNACMHAYIYTCTHTHIYVIHIQTHICARTRFLTEDVRCFPLSLKAMSVMMLEIRPRPLPSTSLLIRYSTDILPLGATQHEVLTASLHKLQTRHSSLLPTDSSSVYLHCCPMLAALMTTFGLAKLVISLLFISSTRARV
jgi:hypothetical protein